MQVYHSEDMGVEQKADDSPLTRADRAAHEVIAAGLRALSSDEILSEEGKQIPWETRQQWRRYWLVDPLDGTKEFIKRNDEFTVNIALIEAGEPVLGVVLAPALGTVYFAAKGYGAYHCELTALPSGAATAEQLKDCAKALAVVAPPSGEQPWRIVGSRSHQSDAFQAFIEQFSHSNIVSMGSSLKLCAVAEGSADLYPRLGLTSEWDTAAAQAVVEAAGGQVINVETGHRLRYNSKAELLNPFFIVCAQLSTQWAIPKGAASS
jgi:3'(2'), 5'-bisphosphate nucleotidase